MRSEHLQPYLIPFQNKKHILIHDQSVGDIITGLLSTHDRYKREYDKICNQFNAGIAENIGFKIWKFLKDNVRYRVEPDSRQMLKSPAAIIQPGTTSDCKNYSLFTGGILDALERKGIKIPWCYRFSSYRLLERTPQHVFVVMYPGTSREIWIDAVLSDYNSHKQYYYKIDKKPKNMSLISLAGIDDVFSIGKKGEKRKAFFKKLKENIKKAGKFTVKIAAAGPRNAALALIKLNFRSAGTNIAKKIKTDPNSVKKFWESLGGNFQKLQTAVSQGEKKKRLGSVEDIDAIGLIDPASQAALISAGGALLLVMVQKLGIGTKEDAQSLQTEKDKADQQVLADIDKEAAGQETTTGNEIVKSEGGNIKTIAIVAGAGLAAYFLIKKK
jgi:hypothetical protein